MNKKEAQKIINSYDPDWFDIRIEDPSFGDGSKYISFPVLYDSEDEAKAVAEAIQVLLIGAKVKIETD